MTPFGFRDGGEDLGSPAMKERTMMKFSARLRALRIGRGLTLEALAEKAGTEKGYLSGIENEKVAPPSSRMIRAIARALKHDAKELLIRAYVEKAPREIRGEIEAALKTSLQV